MFRFFSFSVTSIDFITKVNWPAISIKRTATKPSLVYSCNPSFYSHRVSLTKEEERHRNDLFISSDVIDDMIDHIEENSEENSSQSRSKRSHKKSRKKNSHDSKHSKKNEAVDDNTKSVTEEQLGALSVDAAKKTPKKHRKRKSSKSLSTDTVTTTTEGGPTPCDTTSGGPSKVPAAAAKDTEGDAKDIALSLATIANGDNVKIDKKVNRLKRMKKKILTESNTSSLLIKKPKAVAVVSKESKVSAPDDSSQQKITIAFSQNSGKLASTKSKWDTSSDEEDSARKGAISYRFSEESDPEQSSAATKKIKDLSAADAGSGNQQSKPKSVPFGKMQPGGMLKTIEMHNPLPDLKPSVPIAHPNPGPDGAVARSKTRSRTRSRSARSRSRSGSYSSSDDSFRRSRRRRKHDRRRRSYSRSTSRSRSRSYSSSRSRSRSYSRSYSRSTSRSRSRYRTYSRSSSSSYTSRSYSSRSRSRSPRYTRAVQPKYNNTRAYNLGKRKKFNKKKNQFKNQQNQQPHQNPNIQKQLETGRAKAEETVMRLKKQKEEQEGLQKRAMESIAKAASSAGIPMPTTGAPSSSTPNTSTKSNSPPNSMLNGECRSLCLLWLIVNSCVGNCIALRIFPIWNYVWCIQSRFRKFVKGGLRFNFSFII